MTTRLVTLGIKLCATFKNSISSISYENSLRIFYAKAEAILPLRNCLHFLLFALLGLSAQPVVAKSVEQQLHEQSSRELQRYLQQVGAKAQKQQIDVKVSGAAAGMPDCPNLHISRRQAQEPPLGRLSYQLQCTTPGQHWQGRAVVQIKVWVNLVVASRTIERDEILHPDMLQLTPYEISQLRHGFELTTEALQGLKVRRRISAGQPVGRHLLSQHFLVNNGAIVTIAVNLDGFSASTQGTALENGQLGQKIKVRNNSSGMTIEAVVTGENLVETIAKRN